jgi:hypothetical protein
MDAELRSLANRGTLMWYLRGDAFVDIKQTNSPSAISNGLVNVSTYARGIFSMPRVDSQRRTSDATLLVSFETIFFQNITFFSSHHYILRPLLQLPLSPIEDRQPTLGSSVSFIKRSKREKQKLVRPGDGSHPTMDMSSHPFFTTSNGPPPFPPNYPQLSRIDRSLTCQIC